MNQTNKLRWGIVGCAGIAIRSVIPGIQNSSTGVVSAIASRDLEKSKKTADQLGIPTAYGSYEELLADESIDAVYIPLPNHLHKEWTIRAAQAGKHVLCEKPFALTAAEAEEMVAAAEQAGVHLAEAFMYRFHPRYDRVREIVASGEIGTIRGIHGTFTFNSSGAAENVRFHRHMGGGALYDIGCYPISAARYILGREPEAATVQAMFSERHGGVDMMASGLVEFPDTVGLTFDCAMWAAFRNTLEILGTEGRILLPSAFVCRPDQASSFSVFFGDKERVEEFEPINQYSLQADDFARTVWGQQSVRFAAADAISNMRILDACLLSADERIRVKL
ncbi:Gfo/Idh/MocA family protein [Paenibacillus koleovorans]|uniref:Gfo/Idh/MocA family protein n=1 Tax=Paenibacillus koleovorans TaxID=121608 RepID=UPI000FDAD415|nr:Gfo/Idh/MocA family oxidoreductase [Paenibacillus koleovorans]